MHEVLSESLYNKEQELLEIFNQKFPNIPKRSKHKSIELQKYIDSQINDRSTKRNVENILSQRNYFIDATKSLTNNFPLTFTQDQKSEIMNGKLYLSIFETKDKKSLLIIKEDDNQPGYVIQNLFTKLMNITNKGYSQPKS